ncbi:MAG TPA: GTPase Era [Clostridiales bacterium]|nr:GTPase Era [Clostridiales bacterium]
MGSANVGKSTLLNAILGAKVAIVSKKPQTTRTRVTGIYTREGYQIVFLDTPGIHEPKNKLGEYMVKTAEGAARDADVVLFVADVKTGARERDRALLEKLPAGIPVLIALNKTDAVSEERTAEVEQSLAPFGHKMLRISAATGDGVPALVDELKQYLTESPMFYPADMLTDQPPAMMLAELIREKALKGIGKEIPHGIGVEIEKMEKDEKKGIFNVDAVIYTEKDSHKGIIIGAGGSMLKKIASAARADMEELLHGKVFLQVWVKVKPDWRNKQSALRALGYE